MIFSWPLFLVTFILPGFDFRYGWSAVPTCLVILAYAVTLFGYYLFFLVMKENSYASRVIEVEKDQKVISSGPYAIVRHPMYVCMLIIYTAMPLALGSYWALLTVIPIPFLLAIRIWGEEKVLKKDLKGYTEYTKKVKFRLIPYIW
jgi:protein-S-isoprenylcysteine O-methyltransferase Ste14